MVKGFLRLVFAFTIYQVIGKRIDTLISEELLHSTTLPRLVRTALALNMLAF